MTANKRDPRTVRARQKKAVLLRAMRARKPMKFLRSLASAGMIGRILRQWEKLHAYYRGNQCPSAYKIPKRPPAPNHLRQALEKALAEADAHQGDAFWDGRAALARDILRLFDR